MEEKGNYLSSGPYTTVKGNHLKGLLSDSVTNSDAPLVITDGKPYTWEEVGSPLQAYEGFQLKIELKDVADEWND